MPHWAKGPSMLTSGSPSISGIGCASFVSGGETPSLKDDPDEAVWAVAAVGCAALLVAWPASALADAAASWPRCCCCWAKSSDCWAESTWAYACWADCSARPAHCRASRAYSSARSAAPFACW